MAAGLGFVDLTEERVVLVVGTKEFGSEQDLSGQQQGRQRHLTEVVQHLMFVVEAVVSRQAWHLGGRN